MYILTYEKMDAVIQKAFACHKSLTVFVKINLAHNLDIIPLELTHGDICYDVNKYVDEVARTNRGMPYYDIDRAVETLNQHIEGQSYHAN